MRSGGHNEVGDRIRRHDVGSAKRPRAPERDCRRVVVDPPFNKIYISLDAWSIGPLVGEGRIGEAEMPAFGRYGALRPPQISERCAGLEGIRLA